jgi:hypothetical protein
MRESEKNERRDSNKGRGRGERVKEEDLERRK